MSRVLRPFLMFPRNGQPAFGSAEPEENLGDVVKDFRPASAPVVEVTLEIVQEVVPKASVNPDSSVIDGASDSPDDDEKNSKPSTETTPTPPENLSSSSASPAVPVDAVKVKTQHPSSTTTGKSAPPAVV